jgi:hypothetical protein
MTVIPVIASYLFNISDNGIPNFRKQGIKHGASALLVIDNNSVISPVDITELKFSDLTGSQAINSKQEQYSPVPDGGRALSVIISDKPFNSIPVWSIRECFMREKARSVYGTGHVVGCPLA